MKPGRLHLELGSPTMFSSGEELQYVLCERWVYPERAVIVIEFVTCKLCLAILARAS